MNVDENFSPNRAWAASAASLFISCVVVSGQAAGQVNDAHDAYRCEAGTAFRVLSIQYGDATQSGGCAVLYEKSDVNAPAKAIWSAQFDLQFCRDKMHSTMGKLIASGWQCEPVAANSAPGSKLTPELDRAEITEKDPAAPVATVSPARVPAAITTTPSFRQPPAAVPSGSEPAKSVAGPDLQAALKPKPAASTQPAADYDDWIYRWDEARRQLVFTLYNKTDGSKSRRFSWKHRGLAKDAASPSNIVFIQDKIDRQLIIVAWPSASSQFITVLDPLRKESPVCEIETQTKSDSGWGFGFDKDTIYLTGKKAPSGQPGEFIDFKEACLIAK